MSPDLTNVFIYLIYKHTVIKKIFNNHQALRPRLRIRILGYNYLAKLCMSVSVFMPLFNSKVQNHKMYLHILDTH